MVAALVHQPRQHGEVEGQRLAGMVVAAHEAGRRHPRAGAVVQHHLLALGDVALAHPADLLVELDEALVVEPLQLPAHRGVAGRVQVLAAPLGAPLAQQAPEGVAQVILEHLAQGVDHRHGQHEQRGDVRQGVACLQQAQRDEHHHHRGGEGLDRLLLAPAQLLVALLEGHRVLDQPAQQPHLVGHARRVPDDALGVVLARLAVVGLVPADRQQPRPHLPAAAAAGQVGHQRQQALFGEPGEVVVDGGVVAVQALLGGLLAPQAAQDAGGQLGQLLEPRLQGRLLTLAGVAARRVLPAARRRLAILALLLLAGALAAATLSTPPAIRLLAALLLGPAGLPGRLQQRAGGALQGHHVLVGVEAQAQPVLPGIQLAALRQAAEHQRQVVAVAVVGALDVDRRMVELLL